MPQLPHIPPAAQAIAVTLGVALAITRLLTASKAFWWLFPEWLQKGLPAMLVAVGVLPQALEHAQTWLDVVQALVLSVGAWFTASRGDKRPVEPPKSKGDSGSATKDPEPTRIRFEPPSDEPPPVAAIRIWPSFVAFGIVLACVLSCSPSTVKPPCDESRLRAIDVAFLAEVGAKCLQYPSAAECPDLPALRAKHSAALRAECPQ
jgi:hypothetical protein